MKHELFKEKLNEAYDILFKLYKNEDLDTEQKALVLKAISAIDNNFDWEEEEEEEDFNNKFGRE